MPGRLQAIYAYLLLMQANEGLIKYSAADIAEHLNSEVSDVEKVLDTKFDFNSDINGWENPRMREEMERSAGILHNKRAGAAKAREKKNRELELEPEPDSDIKVDIKPDSKNPKKEEEDLPHGEKFAEAWGRWTKHRSEIKKPLKPTQVKMQLKKLGAMAEKGAVAMIDHTVANGWQGLREPEANFPNGRNRNGNPQAVTRHIPSGEEKVLDLSRDMTAEEALELARSKS